MVTSSIRFAASFASIRETRREKNDQLSASKSCTCKEKDKAVLGLKIQRNHNDKRGVLGGVRYSEGEYRECLLFTVTPRIFAWRGRNTYRCSINIAQKR